jgi:hypothetical protein
MDIVANIPMTVIEVEADPQTTAMTLAYFLGLGLGTALWYQILLKAQNSNCSQTILDSHQ